MQNTQLRRKEIGKRGIMKRFIKDLARERISHVCCNRRSISCGTVCDAFTHNAHA